MFRLRAVLQDAPDGRCPCPVSHAPPCLVPHRLPLPALPRPPGRHRARTRGHLTPPHPDLSQLRTRPNVSPHPSPLEIRPNVARAPPAGWGISGSRSASCGFRIALAPALRPQGRWDAPLGYASLGSGSKALCFYLLFAFIESNDVLKSVNIELLRAVK